MNPQSGLNVPKLKQNVIAYWLEDTRMNWPVKVISAKRGQGAGIGSLVAVRGCVVSGKFVLGRSLTVVEQILGLRPGELNQGAVLLRLNRLPYPTEFDLAGGLHEFGGLSWLSVGSGIESVDSDRGYFGDGAQRRGADGSTLGTHSRWNLHLFAVRACELY